MKWLARVLIGLVLAGGAGVAVSAWFNSNNNPIEQPPEPSPSSQSPSPEPSRSLSPSPNHYPVPAETDLADASSSTIKPVPPLAESDPTLEGALDELLGKKRVEALFNLKDIVRRVVVSVENATKRIQISQEYSPFNPLEGSFSVIDPGGQGENLAIHPNNFRRYRPFVELAQSVDSRRLARIYIHFYPLFQTAYRDLGTKGYFNDRVIEAIDTILNTPEVEAPIHVTRGSVHRIYKYTDPKLEALPAFQKILIRMGRENALLIKAKLRELRELLVHLDPKSSS